MKHIKHSDRKSYRSWGKGITPPIPTPATIAATAASTRTSPSGHSITPVPVNPQRVFNRMLPRSVNRSKYGIKVGSKGRIIPTVKA